MWTVIYITSKEREKNKIRESLEAEGFMVKIRESKYSSQYEIMVLKNEVDEVQEEIRKIIG